MRLRVPPRRRFRRLAPALFLLLAVLALLGGLLTPPGNSDTIQYRIPRLLHWLAAGHWHWIHGYDPRLNVANCGYEWLAAPLVLLTSSDRLYFLPNLVSFLLVPGLVFRLCRQFGIPGRVAWWWMWLVPAGWCFALQAGSTVNDAFSVVYALAALDFALSGWRQRRAQDLCWALLSAALLTGAKQTVMPLVLVCAPPLVAAAPVLWRRPVLAGATTALALLSSPAPTLYLNFRHTGSWSGLTPAVLTDPIYVKFINLPAPLPQPIWGVIGNAFALPLQNLVPPAFPWADAWNQRMEAFVATPAGAPFRSFEGLGHLFKAATEHNAGLGFGLSVLVLLSIFGVVRGRARKGGHSAIAGPASPAPIPLWMRRAIFAGAVVALIAFMSQVGTYTNARQLAPYYPFLLLPLLAARGHADLVRRRWWRMAALAAMLSTALLLITDRGRPVAPWSHIISAVRWAFPHSAALERVQLSFEHTAGLSAQRSLFRAELPKDGSTIGYATLWGTYEVGLWLPLWQRRVERVNPQDTREEMLARGMRYVVVDTDALFIRPDTIETWCAARGARPVAREELFVRPNAPWAPVYLVDLRP